MNEKDFFRAPVDDWNTGHDKLDTDKLDQASRSAQPGDDDLQTARALLHLTHREYEAFGTDGNTRITESDSRILLTALRRILRRHGIALDVPWNNFATFRQHWIELGYTGTWEPRRSLLRGIFDPIDRQLEAREDAQYLSELATPVSPRHATGWADVDAEVDALRLRFRTAVCEQDYRDVGNRSVAVLEALSRTVYNHALHGPADAAEPPADKTNVRIGAYISATLPGSANEDLRGLLKKSSAVAHNIKHSQSPSRRDAGMIADAVILLANLLRRIATAEH